MIWIYVIVVCIAGDYTRAFGSTLCVSVISIARNVVHDIVSNTYLCILSSGLS